MRSRVSHNDRHNGSTVTGPPVGIAHPLDHVVDGGAWILGELVSVDDGERTLHIKVDEGMNEVVPLPDVTNLQVQMGTRSMGAAGLGWGAVIGGAIGAVLFALAYEDGGDFRRSDLVVIGAGAGVLTGGVIGGVLGSVFRAPKWSAVEFD